MRADAAVQAVFLGANYVFTTSTLVSPVGLTLGSADAECASRAAASGHLCCFGVDATRALDPPAGRRASLSSSTTPGGGVAARDAVCAADAAAAGLAGSFRALVATSTASAASRFDLRGLPWVLVDGVAIVSAGADVVNGNLVAPIAVGADGAYSVETRVWTGGRSPSSLGTEGATCADWSDASTTGNGVFGFPDGTEGVAPACRMLSGFFSVETSQCSPGAAGCTATMPCDGVAPVYCLEE